MKCIISCEHASNRVPLRYVHLFHDKGKILSSHQAYDPGAAKLARWLGGELQTPVYLGSITRQLIDLNRSRSNRKSLFTQYSRKLDQNDRSRLLKQYYQPYRENVEEAVGRIANDGKPVLHISVHSFASARKGKVRKADIGLLYDPARKVEKDICAYMAELLKREVVSLQVRRNYPYLGKTDGFTSFLRQRYPAKVYAGIEIEVNQSLLFKNDLKKNKTLKILAKGFCDILKAETFSLTTLRRKYLL
jgi:predicted N-formylglutamate amidohydrolase